ncbi:MAG: DUF1592 domain-containing protein [Myxococcales bacterium]|nr:DUF1592 domain-containing protein [Myxococcales bacterium]
MATRPYAVGLLALFVALLVAGEAAAKKKTPKVFCSPGRFAMALPLLEGGPSPDAFQIEGDMERADVTVSLASGCAPVTAKVKAKRKFTTVKAKWDSCGGFTKVKLKAKIHAPDCAVMTGKLKTKQKPKKRELMAERVSVIGECTDPGADVDPGQKTLHRLNRAEYDNTVRDLLGDLSAPAESFPADDFGDGFDNIADVLSVSPLLVEKWEAAAESLSATALAPLDATAARYEAETADASVGGAVNGGTAWNLWSDGTLRFAVEPEYPGSYEFAVRTYGQRAGNDLPQMRIALDGETLAVVDVAAEAPTFEEVRTSAFLDAGPHDLVVEFTNDFFDPPNDRNLIIDWLELRGPNSSQARRDFRQLLDVCDPASAGLRPCANEVLGAIASLAWRRPVASDELTRYVDLVELADSEGESFSDGITLATRALLLSPHFVFRVERDDDPSSVEAHDLSPHELATRLSYFLWSSAPDAELRALADSGEILDPETIRTQVTRMVQDPKARAFVENFGGQWLQTRALEDVNPDYAVYPEWDDALKDAMRDETHAFLHEFLVTDAQLLGMFDADFTYLNDRLAAHYGLPAPGSASVVRVPLDSEERGGIFTHGSLLTVTSQPRRTSPVKRGKWTLDQILCDAPPPPPPGVEGLLDTNPIEGATLRERMELHRADKICSTCHARMDPIGFGLENFNGVGAWRTTDEDQPIDASGVLPDGRTFTGPSELAAILRSDDRTALCVTERFMTYALGRGIEDADACDIESIATRFVLEGGSMESMLSAIATSDAFRQRRGGPEENE